MDENVTGRDPRITEEYLDDLEKLQGDVMALSFSMGIPMEEAGAMIFREWMKRQAQKAQDSGKVPGERLNN